MKASIKNNILTIEINLNAPKISSSGKSFLLASDTAKNAAEYTAADGSKKAVTVGVNAYFKP
jgi:hypothetical protein